MPNRGLLLTMTEPPPAMEEEFNAWYDDEHMAERLAIPGFTSARRWGPDGKPGEGRYLATYELESLGVLSSEKYLFRFNNQTAWSRRCLGKAIVFKRWACEQFSPGQAETHPEAKAVLLVCGQGELPSVAPEGVLQVRRFKASSGEPADILLVDLAVPKAPVLKGAAPTLLRLYRAYG